MISYQSIKELAANSINENVVVNEKIAGFVLEKLTKKELKIFLRKFKKLASEKTVTVNYEGRLTNELKKNIESMYAGKKINYEEDKTLGGGIVIVDNDLIVNYTIDSMVKSKLNLN